ncbi:BZ3500_MvSof-1268-A1-R1_Chr12-2g03894 [Microbotryum saponariae]|uniref:BZ3500_MvSof-1268-A1-R1_Chr12-2g03894 protein n=1 Tax=Microbotryum saponariae TaxID=289078 RepID=A0A2X0MYS6_9BASI|nr:BZ3500_MvSof-1268-A1-R1_Chr12-2g03894 [Microbotryum saponariae]SCZ99792.1 BZ3501_MvSof-1269-A2-R1_Chr12-2g03494 [Microbotryum saponariae]
MSKYEGRLVLNNFSKLLYKLYTLRFFSALRADCVPAARGPERSRARTKSAAGATANEPFLFASK